MAEVKLQGIYKRFKDTVAVSNFNLEIKDGEFIVLVGPSGCGKSTTLRMVAGLEQPSEGKIYIGDKDVTYAEPKNRDIAMVFQDYALYPHMNVFKNMAFGLQLRKMPKDEIKKRVETAAERLGISHLLHRTPRQLSGGQRQRVALGRSIVRDPQVFLMDEPLSNLDAKLRVQMRAEIVKLQKGLNTTTIYVTHDQVEAMTMGDRIVVMKDGFMQQVGTPSEIYHEPANMFVAGFVGSPSMNFIEGEFVQKDGKCFFTAQGIEVELPGKLSDKSLPSKSVVLGIRPEDIRVDVEKTDNLTSPVECKVELIEDLGAEEIVFLKTKGGQEFKARISSDLSKAQAGNNVNAYFKLNKIHIFDAEEGSKVPLSA
ncbi:MAG: multiple sugar transport system ATP-binding protein [Clostridia bacterium]|nr:multiple sugar transport system ATP-binding protein [Clostridia bacterium]